MVGAARVDLNVSVREEPLQERPGMDDSPSMEYEHHCGFCGWRREAASPTMLRPHCERCGCLLEARTTLLQPAERREWRMPSLPPRVVVALALAGMLPVAAFAARFGYEFGGPAGAVLAAIVTLLMTFIAAAPAGGHR
jgi:hypothetical protein